MRNVFFYWVGLIILALNKVRHTIQGYRRPRPFPVSEIGKAADYDLDVTSRWEKQLEIYLGKKRVYKAKTILELGPGADLGNGVILCHKGAKKYFALDVNRLAPLAPDALYEELIKRLSAKKSLLGHVHDALDGAGRCIEYVVDKAFDPRTLKNEGIDLVVSNAAFEHFDDVDETIARLSKTVKRGAVFIADVDLQTHTRWIRDADPLNIYRYGSGIYNMFKFLGSPNRVRPIDYVQIMKKHGWKKVQMVPRIEMKKEDVDAVRDRLSASFRDDKHLGVLDFYLIAKKG